jgi:hypothetical protein
MCLLGFVLKLGLHPVAVAHLGPGTSSLLVSQIPTGGSKDIGRECKQMLYTFVLCSIDLLLTRGTTCNLVLLQDNPFFYCFDQIFVHLLAVLDG